MARLLFNVSTTAEVALTTAAKTVVHVGAAANTRVAVRGFTISFDGVSSTAGSAQVILAIQSSSGSASAVTVEKQIRGTTEALSSTGLFNFTVEPVQTYLKVYNVSPQTGYERAFAPDEEIQLNGGVRLGIQVIASSAVNCVAGLFCEE
jgi:hypothetical protein